MDSWLTSVDVITLFVEDVQRAKSFYHDVFDLSTVYEDDHSAVVNFDNLTINLLVSTQAPGLIAPAKVATADAGSRFQFTIRVDDVDEACAELKTRGVTHRSRRSYLGGRERLIAVGDSRADRFIRADVRTSWIYG
jgi:catechol 2,3-dioxygenase-like lactoylglutathione lyase family enzyme